MRIWEMTTKKQVLMRMPFAATAGVLVVVL